jgi:hypothetical protein
MGAASTTTGSIAAHEMTQDSSQWARNWRIVTNGKLATAAAIRHVNPAWIAAKIKWLNRRGMPNMWMILVARSNCGAGKTVDFCFKVNGAQSAI